MNGFKSFLHETDAPKGKTRTINVKASTHDFYRKTAIHYDVGISTLVNNILEHWMEENKPGIIEDMKSNLDV
ncbi:MAG: hypothetical protein ABJ004_12415 [Cyclobacteriaceae bacterium]